VSRSAPHRERLDRLRARLRQAGVDGFYLPRTDRHGNEFLPPSEERVAYLTGFTGSFAVLAVLQDGAALFTDGRYRLQAREEVDGSLFEIHEVPAHEPERWLAERTPSGGRIGFDPYLVSRRTRDRLARALAAKDAVPVALADNPVDAVWHERPAPPRERAFWLPISYAGEPCAAKCRRVGERIAELGAEWLLITRPDALCWLLNLRGGDIPFNPLVLGFGLLHRSGRLRWFVDAAKLPAEPPPEGVEVAPYEELAAALEAIGEAAVAADPGLVHLGFLEHIKAGGARLVEVDDPILALKAVKNPIEAEGMRRSQIRDGRAVIRFLHWLDGLPLDGSVSEWDLAERLAQERSQDPLFLGPSFPSIVAHGPNGAVVHYRTEPARARPITAGTLLLVDSGAHYLDGTTDITRTVALGEPSREMRERFTAVLEGHISLARLRVPKGTRGVQIDAFARKALWDLGLDYDHGTGHGVGHVLCVHETPPRLAKRGAEAELLAGMVFSNEPGYYREGAYGIRIENLMLVHAEEAAGGERPMLGFETLTLVPIDRRLILPERLSPEARAWLDSYHARVLEVQGPELEEPVRTWLEQACAPLG